jgi:hypothetical protein
MSMTQASSDFFNQVAGSRDQTSDEYFGKRVHQAAIDKACLRSEMQSVIASDSEPGANRLYSHSWHCCDPSSCGCK